ncbi:MAG: hypothetical protein ISR64_02045 [Deltaproteobacteria bacterium]|nr:hypothetical protein [Deltaproteobacteria bacterium]
MNGVDAVLLATGNDFRAVEAGPMPLPPGAGPTGPSVSGPVRNRAPCRVGLKCPWPWAWWEARPVYTPRPASPWTSWEPPRRRTWQRRPPPRAWPTTSPPCGHCPRRAS